jgi:hypothetical protein
MGKRYRKTVKCLTTNIETNGSQTPSYLSIAGGDRTRRSGSGSRLRLVHVQHCLTAVNVSNGESKPNGRERNT